VTARERFAAAAAEDGIVLLSGSFDWLCEQGHVGLERVAKRRRDPSLVGPVTAALAQLGAIHARLEGDLSVLHASRENLLLPVELVHEPTGTVMEVDEPAHFTSFRLAALELYPADAAVGFDLDEQRRSAAPGAPAPTASPATCPPRASASAESSASAPTTTRSSTWPPPPWATRRWSASPSWTATARQPTTAAGRRCGASARPMRSTRRTRRSRTR
jgi:hypothetical protein